MEGVEIPTDISEWRLITVPGLEIPLIIPKWITFHVLIEASNPSDFDFRIPSTSSSIYVWDKVIKRDWESIADVSTESFPLGSHSVNTFGTEIKVRLDESKLGAYITIACRLFARFWRENIEPIIRRILWLRNIAEYIWDTLLGWVTNQAWSNYFNTIYNFIRSLTDEPVQFRVKGQATVNILWLSIPVSFETEESY